LQDAKKQYQEDLKLRQVRGRGGQDDFHDFEQLPSRSDQREHTEKDLINEQQAKKEQEELLDHLSEKERERQILNHKLFQAAKEGNVQEVMITNPLS
jgi:hypothetical protein